MAYCTEHLITSINSLNVIFAFRALFTVFNNHLTSFIIVIITHNQIAIVIFIKFDILEFIISSSDIDIINNIIANLIDKWIII